MKKGKMIVSALALLVAAGAAYAFKVNSALPGDLYYRNSLNQCVEAPCETTNNTDNPCQNSPLYTQVGCPPTAVFSGQAWTTDGGK